MTDQQLGPTDSGPVGGGGGGDDPTGGGGAQFGNDFGDPNGGRGANDGFAALTKLQFGP
jgi:hypothetical protein